MSLYNTGSKIDTRNTGTDFTRKEGNREMKCPYCNESGFLGSNKLNEHIKTKHGK